ncbi:MAG: TetR/AcrR family transcriptional regulator [Saprospiraceae bacterium]
MSTTKKKILDASRKLFNQQGLSAVSQRTIAAHLKISPGNLTYHFKKRNEIIEGLYFELVEKIDHAFLNVEMGEGLIVGLYQLTHQSMQNLFEYRFMMLDFIQVMREFPTIKKHYLKLITQREEQMKMFIQMLIQAGLLRKEEIENEYQNLIRRMMILSDFWLASAEISHEKMNKKQIEKYLEITSQVIYPYLTVKGKREYRKLEKN